MIIILNIFIDLCLIFAVSRIAQRKPQQPGWTIKHEHPANDIAPFAGRIAKIEVKSAIAEKMAERAFNMASSSNLGVIALQKALAVPRILTKPQVQENQLAKDKVDELFGGAGKLDYLWPILDDEERAILEDIEKRNAAKLNGQ